MSINPLENQRIVDLGDEKILLDPKRFEFSDATLTKFQEETSIFYDYYSAKACKAEGLLLDAKAVYESAYDARFIASKDDDGRSDKAAEAVARMATNDLKLEVNRLTTIVKQLKQYLDSYDNAVQLARSRGFQLQKELDKLNSDIYSNKQFNIDDIIGK